MQHNLPFSTQYYGQQKQQPKRPKRLGKKPLVFIVVLFFVLIFVAVFVESPLSKVRTITVSGTSQVDPADVIKYSGIEKGESIWKVHAGEVEQQVTSKLPLIQKVDVSAHYVTGQVEIAVAEKSFAAVYISNAKQYRVLNDGTIFDQIPLGSAINMPIISADTMEDVSIGQKLKNKQLDVLCSQIFNLPPGLLQLVSEIHVNSDDTWTAFMKDGNEVIMPSGTLNQNLKPYPDFKKQLEDKKQPPGTIHIYNGQPVYHPYDTKGT
jgi:cell division protein FtsQ